MDSSNARIPRNPEQLSLFDTGETITTLDVDALQGDPEAIRGAARELVTLVRYHAARTEEKS
jgi:hypothetical protein